MSEHKIPCFGELEVVRLTQELLAAVNVGAEGTIVAVHDGGEAYEVEFADDEGNTIGVFTLPECALEATGKADP